MMKTRKLVVNIKKKKKNKTGIHNIVN